MDNGPEFIAERLAGVVDLAASAEGVLQLAPGILRRLPSPATACSALNWPCARLDLRQQGPQQRGSVPIFEVNMHLFMINVAEAWSIEGFAERHFVAAPPPIASAPSRVRWAASSRALLRIPHLGDPQPAGSWLAVESLP
jgi:hypothetical protein